MNSHKQRGTKMESLELSNKESFNESIKREQYLSENAPQSIDQIRYDYIVHKNTVAALLAGAELTARDGKTRWSLSKIDTTGMTQNQINLEARVMASYVVG